MCVNCKKFNLNRRNFGLYDDFEIFTLFHINIGVFQWKNSIQIASQHRVLAFITNYNSLENLPTWQPQLPILQFGFQDPELDEFITGGSKLHLLGTWHPSDHVKMHPTLNGSECGPFGAHNVLGRDQLSFDGHGFLC